MTRLFSAKPYIIAEVGSNWRTLNDCIQSIGQAKAVGADAVKFQAFNAKALYGFLATSDEPENRYPGSYFNLPLDWLPKLKEKADACGIELMCTAFSPELVAAVDPYVSVHKVASSDICYPQLLEAVHKTEKPVLLSTGAKHAREVEYAADYIFARRNVMMFCVAAYPAPYIDLYSLDLLHDVTKCPVGLSDHSQGISIAVEACRRHDVVALEKHFTAFPDMDTPDRPHSIGPDLFKLMVEQIRNCDQAYIGPRPEERDMLLRHNRRLITTRDVAEGEVLKYGENFGAYRSLKDDARGLSPFAWRDVEGKAAKKAIARGDSVGPGDFG